MLTLPKAISFAKVRISYAQVGNDIPSLKHMLATSSISGSLVTPNRTVLKTLEPEPRVLGNWY